MQRPTQQSSSFLRKQLLPIVAVAIIYAVLARLGLLMAIPKTNTSPVWPPSGFAFAAVLILGRRVWPGITLGAFIGNLLTFLDHPPAGLPMIVTASIVISIGNTLEALTGSFLLEKLIDGRRNPLDRTSDSMWFVIVAGVMCLVACTIGPTFLCAAGFAKWSLFPVIWSTWWVGDTTGILILTPTVLAWYDKGRSQLSASRAGELALAVAVVIAVAVALFQQAPSDNPLQRQVYLILPPILWIVFRFHAREALTVTTFVSIIAVRCTVQGYGAFTDGSVNTSLELLQIFISVLTITSVMLGAVCAERTRAEMAVAERAEREAGLHEHERNIATTLQQALQPSEFCRIPGLSLDFYYKAALNEAQIGGDFYDVFPISESKYVLVIGDISGKGLAAAIQVASVRNMLRCALYLRGDVREAVTELNKILNENELLAGFATALICVYDTRTRQFTHVSCGHEPALLYGASTREITRLSPTGPPLGIAPFDYEDRTTTLSPGDMLVLYTDGISEVKVEGGDLLGVEGLSRILGVCATQCKDPSALIERIVRDVEKTIVAPFRDDACIIAMTVE